MTTVADPRDSEVLDCLACDELYEAADGHRCPTEAHDAGQVAVSVVLLTCMLGGLAWLGLIHLGQQALCDLQGPTRTYCDGYEATR